MGVKVIFFCFCFSAFDFGVVGDVSEVGLEEGTLSGSELEHGEASVGRAFEATGTATCCGSRGATGAATSRGAEAPTAGTATGSATGTATLPPEVAVSCATVSPCTSFAWLATSDLREVCAVEFSRF